MGKYLYIGLWLLVCFRGITQSVPLLTQIADDLYDNHRFLEAIEFYDKIAGLAETDYRAKYRLATCYLESLKYPEAEEIFKELGSITDPENAYRARAIYKYAAILKTDYLFKESDSLFAYIISISDDQELIKLARKQKEGCLLALGQSKVDRGYSIQFMDHVNSKYHDFGAVINPSNGQLVFATTQNLGGVQYQGSQFEGVLPDLASYKKAQTRWRNNSNAQRFNRLNTEWSEGTGSFTKDGQKFYFSSCKGESGSGCQIMVSNLVNGKWSDPQPLNKYINEKGSENKQPFVSITGDTLFFSSDRSGGYGGSDIWMSLKGISSESWGPAINMGDVINSAEDDITPYYSSVFRCLIFASKGHVGYGGFDLYAAKGTSFFEGELYNLGVPFNSPLDDSYFNVSDSLGFISSNREDSRLLNIYSFDVKDERLFLLSLISEESLIDGQVISKFRNVRSLDLFAFRVEDYQEYELFTPEMRIKPIPSIIAGREAEVMTITNNSIINYGTTDRDTEAYSNSGIEKSYSTELVNGSTAYSLDYEHIYFKFGSAMLEPAAKSALKDLVSQLDDIQFSSVEILAYTDVVGPTRYNQKLSEHRGEAVKHYLSELGLSENLINVRPRGEGPLSSSASWYSRMFSRRAEIIINVNTPININRAKPYALRAEKRVTEIEKLLGIKKGQLKEYNMFESDTFEIGSIVRIPESLGLTPNIKYFLEEEDLKNSFFIYRVKPNETLAMIARKYNTMEELIAEVNNLDGELDVGDEIYIYKIQ
ncbi:MAG: OmpA family protein [Bacteroidota bacterium]